ncbi:MAG: hypothetical protein KatS3mg102_0265 [Planctomycetota bacterium]|nr:MAG: hypothetical protein KatS3mg102_0265 [Planctomycetota bacterium]
MGRHHRTLPHRLRALVLLLPALLLAGCGATLIGALTAVATSGGGGGSSGGGGSPPTNQPPVLVLIESPPDPAVGTVALRYRLLDAESDPADLLVEYSLGGGPFLGASAAADSDGTAGLGTSPMGVEYRFVWNAFFDTGAVDEQVVLRLTPREAASGVSGTAVLTEPFTLRNSWIATVFNGLGDDAQERLAIPDGLAVLRDEAGTVLALLVSDTFNHRVLRLDALSGAVTVLAGTGEPGFNGDDQPASQARLSSPRGLAVDAAGNVYVADAGNQRIRRVDGETGFITTVAGGGGGARGDGGLATEARLVLPVAVALDDDGNLYVADAGESRIRVVNRTSQRIEVGRDERGDPVCVEPAFIETLVRLGDVLDDSGLPIVGGGTITGKLGGRPALADIVVQGRPGTIPFGADCDAVVSSSSLVAFVADPGTGSVVRRAADGTIEVFAGRKAGDTDVAAPQGLWLLPTQLLFADSEAHVVWGKVLDGTLTAGRVAGQVGEPGFEGDGGSPLAAKLNGPRKPVQFSYEGQEILAIADGFNRALRAANRGSQPVVLGGVAIAASTIETLLAGGGSGEQVAVPVGVAVHPDSGEVLWTDAQNGRLLRLEPASGAVAEVAAGLQGPRGLAVSPDRAAVALALAEAHRVVRVELATGAVSVLAGTGQPTSGVSDLGDGGQATEATLNGPTDVAFDAQGRLYIADAGNHRVRRVLLDGTIETFVNSKQADGKPAAGTAANELDGPSGVSVDAGAQKLLIADTNNHRVLAVALAPSQVPVGTGDVTLIAGATEGNTPVSGYNGDNRPAVGAKLHGPLRAIPSSTGQKVLVSDADNHRVRVIAGDVYGGGGIIDTAAGTGQATFNGDARPAVNAALNLPSGIAVDPATGAVFIADTGNLRLRRFGEP